MHQHKRKRLLIDKQLQGSLMIRVAVYWLACLATIELLSLSWLMATGPDQPSYVAYFLNQDWRPVGVRFAASLMVLLLIISDMLRLSNRFAGPAYRMRHVLRKVAETGQVQKVQLRGTDFWQSFAQELNLALDRLANDRHKSEGQFVPQEGPADNQDLPSDLRPLARQ